MFFLLKNDLLLLLLFFGMNGHRGPPIQTNHYTRTNMVFQKTVLDEHWSTPFMILFSVFSATCLVLKCMLMLHNGLQVH
jgi:hypothetical protein